MVGTKLTFETISNLKEKIINFPNSTIKLFGRVYAEISKGLKNELIKLNVPIVTYNNKFYLDSYYWQQIKTIHGKIHTSY